MLARRKIYQTNRKIYIKKNPVSSNTNPDAIFTSPNNNVNYFEPYIEITKLDQVLGEGVYYSILLSTDNTGVD